MDSIVNDIRYGLRNLAKRPAFTAVAIVTLALGIGANTLVFSLVNGLLLRPRPISQAEQVVELFVGDNSQQYQTAAYQDHLIFREQRDVLSDLAGYHIAQFKLQGAENVQLIWGEAVTANYFDVIGVKPTLGRSFIQEEGQTSGTHPVVMISHSLWQRRLNSDPSVIGQKITLNRQALTVIGVLPPEYNGMIRGLAADVWVPVMMLPQLVPQQGERMLTSRGNSFLFQVGRLAPGKTVAEAQARFDVVSRQLQEAYPDSWNEKREGSDQVRTKRVTVLAESDTRLPPDTHSVAYAAIALVLVMINLVLLIACMNLASLLLARAMTRRREIAVRLALGAARRRIVQQLLIESVLLSLCAGVAGVVFSTWIIKVAAAFVPTLPEGIRISLDIPLDWRVFSYTLAFATLVGIAFGLIPALRVSRPDLIGSLKENANQLSGDRRQSRLRNGLIVAQVAFSFLLLVSAGLMVRSLRNISPAQIGFESTNMVVARINLEEHQYDRKRAQEFFRQLELQTRTIPGVTQVGFVDELPGGVLGGARRSVQIEGVHGPNDSVAMDASIISHDYLDTMGLPVVAGRGFNERDVDQAPCVALVNEDFQQQYFPDRQALGKHLIKHESNKPVSCEIVGVVRDDKVRQLQPKSLPWFAYSLAQTKSLSSTMLVKTSVPPDSIVPVVRRTIVSADPSIAVDDVGTLNSAFAPMSYLYGAFGVAAAACGGLALVLACLGIYGTVAYGVGHRTKEIGVRMALGAQSADILRLVSRQILIMVSVGLVFGLLLAFALTRVLTSSEFEIPLLWGISPTDPLVFSVVAFFLASVALLACYLPARKATKVDALVALRYE